MHKTVEYVRNHPLNKSKAKEAYGFSKAERFPKPNSSAYIMIVTQVQASCIYESISYPITLQ